MHQAQLANDMIQQAGDEFTSIVEQAAQMQENTSYLLRSAAAKLKKADGSPLSAPDRGGHATLWTLLINDAYATLGHPDFGASGVANMLDLVLYTCDTALDPAPQSADREAVKSKLHEFYHSESQVEMLLNKWARSLTAVYDLTKPQRDEFSSPHPQPRAGKALVAVFKSALELIVATECWTSLS